MTLPAESPRAGFVVGAEDLAASCYSFHSASIPSTSSTI